MEIQLRWWFYWFSFADVVVITKQQVGFKCLIDFQLNTDFPSQFCIFYHKIT